MSDVKSVNNKSGKTTLTSWTTCDASSKASYESIVFFDKVRTVCNIDTVVRIPEEATQKLYWVTRPSHGLMFQMEGEMKYYYDGKEYVVPENHVIYFPKGRKYSGRLQTAKAVCLCVNFQIDEEILCEPRVYHWECDQKIKRLFEELNLEWIRQKNPYGCMCILYSILSCVYAAHHAPYASPQKRHRFQEVKDYIDVHFTEPEISVDSVSKAVGISPVYMRKLFSEYAMMSPSEYITTLRIRYAKGLLQAGNLSISKIAETVGYQDCGYFSKKFKAIAGCSPHRYRS